SNPRVEPLDGPEQFAEPVEEPEEHLQVDRGGQVQVGAGGERPAAGLLVAVVGECDDHRLAPGGPVVEVEGQGVAVAAGGVDPEDDDVRVPDVGGPQGGRAVGRDADG